MSMTTLPVLRTADRGDLDGVRELLRLAFRRYEVELSGEIFQRQMADMPPAEQELPRTIVADAGNRIVCTARLYAPGDSGVALPSDAALIRAVAVHPDAEGAGLARELMAECQQRARQACATALMLHTATFMTRAIRLYERLGYQRAPEWDIDAATHDRNHRSSTITVIAYRLEI